MLVVTKKLDVFCLDFFVLRVVNCSRGRTWGDMFCPKQLVNWWVKQMSSDQQKPGKICCTKGIRKYPSIGGGCFRNHETCHERMRISWNFMSGFCCFLPIHKRSLWGEPKSFHPRDGDFSFRSLFAGKKHNNDPKHCRNVYKGWWKMNF